MILLNLKMKLNTIDQEFRDKTVLIIDDSIVRGNTSMQIIEIIRKAGAKRIILGKRPSNSGCNLDFFARIFDLIGALGSNRPVKAPAPMKRIL